MRTFLDEVIEKYLVEKRKPFKGNILADKLRNDFPKYVHSIIPDKERYKVVGSRGKGNWAECPWVAILDRLVTKSPQSGFYPVFLFRSDMRGVYLSLNQGVTEVRENYRRETGNVLKVRAQDYRAKLDILIHDDTEIDLNSTAENARLYECGNIVNRYYMASHLPTVEKLQTDIY